MAKRKQTYERDARKKKALRIRMAIALREEKAESAEGTKPSTEGQSAE